MSTTHILFNGSPNGFITGAAGTGKTHLVQTAIRNNPSWGILAATTGVAARNLGPNVPTIHSLLGFRSLSDLQRIYENGHLQETMHQLRNRAHRIVLDEVSMLSRAAFEMIYQDARSAGMGLVLVGDFLQLPPVPDKEWPGADGKEFLFKSDLFTDYAPNMILLTEHHRTKNPTMLEALAHLRSGRGWPAVAKLVECDVRFDPGYDLASASGSGVVLVGRNSTRAKINAERYARLPGTEVVYRKTAWGNQRKEWYELPEQVAVKVGTRVMILRNLYSHGELVQANGDTGVVQDLDADVVSVRMDRDGTIADVERDELDDAYVIGHEWFEKNGQQMRRTLKSTPTGGVTWMPLTPAWALTTHKAQGLSLDAVTVALDSDKWMFGQAAVLYVAISRCRKPEGLRIVGSPETLARACRISPEVKRWI